MASVKAVDPGKTGASRRLAIAGPAQGYSIDTVLECSRGIAALWVFMFHIADMFRPVSPLLFEVASYGYFGVPLFFAISGYCMFASAESTIAKGGTPRSFLQRRLLRVMPPFWLSILVVLAVPFIIAMVSAAKSGRYDYPVSIWMSFTALDWLQLLTLTRALFQNHLEAQAAYSPVNSVYWTLAIELQFYLVVAAALYFHSAWKRVVVAVLGLSLITSIWNVADDSLFLQYWAAFVLGMALRLAHVKGITPARVFRAQEIACSMAGAMAIVVGGFVFMLHPSLAIPAGSVTAWLAFTLAALASIVFLWLMGGVEHGLRFSGELTRSWRGAAWLLLPLCWLGQCSYSLYLLHGKIYQLPAMFVRQLVSQSSILFPALTIFLTAILCFAFYAVAERPFQQSQAIPFRRRPAGATLALSEKTA